VAKVPAAKAPAAKPSPKAPATTGAVTSSTPAARRIAIDGVSLTINGVSDDGFDVCLIPHTLSKTHLPERKVGDGVNLESDVIGKYVKRPAQPRRRGADLVGRRRPAAPRRIPALS